MDNALVRDGAVVVSGGKVKQRVALKLLPAVRRYCMRVLSNNLFGLGCAIRAVLRKGAFVPKKMGRLVIGRCHKVTSMKAALSFQKLQTHVKLSVFFC